MGWHQQATRAAQNEAHSLEPASIRQRDGGKTRARELQRLRRVLTAEGWNGGGSVAFYKFGEVVGEGAFGKVRLAVHLPTTHKVAIKSYCSNKMKTKTAWRAQAKQLNTALRPAAGTPLDAHPHILPHAVLCNATPSLPLSHVWCVVWRHPAERAGVAARSAGHPQGGTRRTQQCRWWHRLSSLAISLWVYSRSFRTVDFYTHTHTRPFLFRLPSPPSRCV